MDIYSLNKKEMWNALKAFYRCEYGKIQFLLSYAVFFIFLLFLIFFLVLSFQESMSWFPVAHFVAFVFAINTLIAFVLGSMHYYKELRFFVYKRSKKELR